MENSPGTERLISHKNSGKKDYLFSCNYGWKNIILQKDRLTQVERLNQLVLFFVLNLEVFNLFERKH